MSHSAKVMLAECRLPLVKFNCADDAYVFPLEFCDLVSRNSRIGWNESGERLVDRTPEQDTRARGQREVMRSDLEP
jgi:hypothetical protein